MNLLLEIELLIQKHYSWNNQYPVYKLSAVRLLTKHHLENKQWTAYKFGLKIN